jgi:hypothetical protein
VRDKKTKNLSPSPLPSGKRKRRSFSNGEWQKVSSSVQMELRHLRSLLEEITSSYLIKRQAQIESLISSLSENEFVKKEQDIRSIQKNLRSLKVKPEKGRYKDLKKVEDLIANLQRIMEGW